MTTALTEQERAEHVTSRRAEGTALRYLAAFALICVVMYVLPIVLERLPALQPYAGSDWGLMLDHSYNLQNTNADIVIFGDSSALYGIDTPRLSTELGLKVINLPQSIGSLVVSGDLPLRKYLAANKPPRMIIFYFTPWNLDFETAADDHSYEGTEQLVRHGSGAELMHVLRVKPRRLLTFPLSFYLVHSSLTRLWTSGGFKSTMQNGFSPYPANLEGPLIASCTIPQQLVNSSTDRSLQKLRTDFAHEGTEMVTVLAPVPQCKGADQLKARLGSSLDVMPHGDFANDMMLVHLRADHAAEATERLAGILRPQLEQTR